MEERDNKTVQSQPSSYPAGVPGPSPARMAALPHASPAHGASPLPTQRPQQSLQPQQQPQQQQHYYAHTNGHQPTPPQHEYRMPHPNALPSVSLPPIQHFEPAQNAIPPQPQYTYDTQHQMAQQPPIPHGAYQYQNGSMPMIPAAGQVLYASRDGYPDRRYTPPPLHPYQAHILPHNPLDPRQMSGGRHKKEIKRRTKTGCLTCRKRRIKCDERQPGCRNCEKSKRECLGYDPIFKQQSGPAPIQPAPMAMPKPENGMSMVYAQPTYQGEQDIYGAVRVPPQSAAPSSTAYAAYPQASMDNNAGQSAVPQHYHPPFESAHKSEPQHPKA